MSTPKICIFCNNPLAEPSENNPPSEQIIRENIAQEIKSIDYLLREVPAWKANKLITPSVEQELFRFYGSRHNTLVKNLLSNKTQNQESAKSISNPITITSDSSAITPTTPNTFIIKPVDPISEQEDNLTLEPNLSENLQPNTPSHISPNIGVNIENQRPISSNLAVQRNIASDSQPPPRPRPYTPYTPPPPPPVQKSLGELVSENINYIFAACAALFVGGIALYYRNELYHGLSQPITQAAILMIVTLGFLVSGIFLVRQTSQAIAGRTLALVGSLLVPINPWFLVSSHLIANTGRGWILGVACTVLYASLTYFLKDPLFVYLSLTTGMITTWVGVYHFSNNVIHFSSYATALIAYSILSLLAEQIFKSNQGEFTREKFGRPFFHFAQIGIALTLLFYTPLVSFLPREFVAAKMYFDPSYNSLVTVWLALGAAFAYAYSSLIRRASYFVYLSIAALYWSEISLFIYLKSNPGQAILVITVTTLLLAIVGQKSSLEKLYREPMTLVATILGNVFVALGVIFLVFGITTSWEFILSFLIIATMFQTNLLEESLIKQNKENIPYQVGLLVLTAYIMFLTKLALDKDFFLLLMPLPVLAALTLSYLTATDKKDNLAISWQNVSLVCIAVAVYKLAQISFNKDFSYPTLAIFWLEISLGFTIFSYLVKKETSALITAILSSGILVISYSLCLAHFDYLLHKESILAYALLAFVYYGISQTSLLWAKMKQALSYLSTVLVSVLLLISSAVVTDIYLTKIASPKSFFVLLALVLIGAKEFWHLWKDRNALHSALLGINGVILLALSFGLANIFTPEYLFLAEIILATGYLVLAYKLAQEKVSQQVCGTFEALANITVIFSAVWLLVVGYNSRLESFSIITCLSYIAIAFFYFLATQLTENSNLVKGYAYTTFSVMLIVVCLVCNHLGLHTWADLAGVLIPILIGYLFINRLLENTKFSTASIMVAQVAHPIVVILGIVSSLSRSNPPLGGAIFFGEITAFYLCLALLTTQSYALYIGVITSMLSLLKLLDHFDANFSYLSIFYAFYGLALFHIANKNKGKYEWINLVLYNSGHGILGLSAIALVLQTFASLTLNKAELTPYVISLIIMISIFGWVSLILEDETLKNIYKQSAFVLSGVAYLSIGIRLGFSLLIETEFYSLPLAIFMLWNGYRARLRNDDSSTFWLVIGSVLCVLPTLLHVMHFRFISAESSASYDFILISVSLGLMLSGILLEMKPIAKIGQAAFIIELAIIVFSAVNWEQQGLSILMILLAVGIFIAAWTIHNRYKNHQQAQSQNNRFNIHQ